MAKRSRLAAPLCARVFVMRETQTYRAPAKYGHVSRETGPVQGKSGVGPAFRSSVIPVSSDPSNKIKEAERRQTLGNNRRILRCGARPFGARTLDGVPPRFSPRGVISSPRLSLRPGFLGLGLNGRYPPSPVPVQGCTPHPGRNAGRHDAQAAREQTAKPPAGTALAPMTRCASAPCPSPERGSWCNWNRDGCQSHVPAKVTMVVADAAALDASQRILLVSRFEI
jgi:hypothetical protein